MRNPVELGDQVRDPLTEQVGIAYARVQYLYGCDRIRMQLPVIEKKGEAVIVPDLWEVDEPQLTIVKRGKVKRQIPKAEAKKDGGPSKHVPRAGTQK